MYAVQVVQTKDSIQTKRTEKRTLCHMVPATEPKKGDQYGSRKEAEGKIGHGDWPIEKEPETKMSGNRREQKAMASLNSTY